MMRPTHIMVGSHQQRTTAYHLSDTTSTRLRKKKKPATIHDKYCGPETAKSWTNMDQTFQTLHGRGMKDLASIWKVAKVWNLSRFIPPDWPR